MIRLALRMLFGDRAKYLMLISGITFATLLMAQASSLFCGIMTWTFSTLRNVRAEIWVADSQVEQVNDTKPLRDTDVFRVRSVDGVAWAVPLYVGLLQARLDDGRFKGVTLVGLDATSLVGAPRPEWMRAGRLEDLRLPDTVIIDDLAVDRLSEGRAERIGLGDTFEMNDRTARVVGICQSYRSFTGGPYVYTTYDRAVLYAPGQRRLLSFVLVGGDGSVPTDALTARIEAKTGLRAWEEDQFRWQTMLWYVRNTGIPYNVGLLVVIGFIVGTVISGQTFYDFVHENTRNLGALKAMGTSTGRLCAMLIVQSFTVGAIGYGIGIGVVSLIGRALNRTGKVPFLLLPEIPAIVFLVVIVICSFSALLGIARVARLDPATVFRS